MTYYVRFIFDQTPDRASLDYRPAASLGWLCDTFHCPSVTDAARLVRRFARRRGQGRGRFHGAGTQGTGATRLYTTQEELEALWAAGWPWTGSDVVVTVVRYGARNNWDTFPALVAVLPGQSPVRLREAGGISDAARLTVPELAAWIDLYGLPTIA